MSLLATHHFQNNSGYFLAGIEFIQSLKLILKILKLIFESRTLTKDFFLKKNYQN
jgi:hypothetical protein